MLCVCRSDSAGAPELACVFKKKKRKDIAVSIGDLEAPQPTVDQRQLLHERRTALAELFEEHVGVRSVDVGIPTSPFMPGVVWTWQHVWKNGLEHDAGLVAAHPAVVRVILWTLEVQLETEALDVIRDRRLQVLDDEERSDRREVSVRLFGVCAL